MLILIQHLPEWVPQFLVAALQTLELTAASFMIAVVVGVAVALLRRVYAPGLRDIAHLQMGSP